MVVMADGAGSAAFSDVGSRIVCQAGLKALEDAALNVKEPSEEEWKKSFSEAAEKARQAVVDHAAQEKHPVNGYASTLIMVVATATGAGAFQIGDGAVVLLGQDEQMSCLTTPVESEYLNETVFLTRENSVQNGQFKLMKLPLKAVAVLTDGLQMLALKMPAATPHAPFFQPLFRFAAAEPDQEVRNEKLQTLLRSPRITQRADDDLTLLLAVLEGLPEKQTQVS